MVDLEALAGGAALAEWLGKVWIQRMLVESKPSARNSSVEAPSITYK